MKNSVNIARILIAGSLAFTSCTKDLKNDISNLKKNAAAQHSKIDSIAERMDNIDIILGANEPITVTTTFADDNNSTRTIKGTYSFKSSNNVTQFARAQEDGSYLIHVERYLGIYSEERVSVLFRYDPASKEITQKEVVHEWDDADSYFDNASYGDYYANHEGLSINISVNNFNTTTGEISLAVAASGNADYATLMHYYNRSPNNTPYSTSFSFTGKVKIFPYSGN